MRWDAAQEALIQIVTKLDRFAGHSGFTTWAYRVATNKFLSIARVRGDDVLDVDWLKDELARLPPVGVAPPGEIDEDLLAEEIKIGCTLGMLLILEPGHRMAYVLGEIMGLDHATAASILDIAPATYRKRLQRSRGQIRNLMRSRCGLYDPRNTCRCPNWIPTAIEAGRLNPHQLAYGASHETARRFPGLLAQLRNLEEAERAGALYRSHPEVTIKADLASFIDRLSTTWPRPAHQGPRDHSGHTLRSTLGSGE